MLDLGTSFVAAVARDGNAIAIVDGDVRLSYRDWYGRISALVGAFDELGLRPGDHVVTVLQNRWEAATLHWACQFAGLIITPLNWRFTSNELDFCLADAAAKAVIYEGVSSSSVAGSSEARKAPRIAVGLAQSGNVRFEALIDRKTLLIEPRVGADACSAAIALNGRPLSRMSRKISTAAGSARSVSCRSITPWACARSLRCRSSAARLCVCPGSRRRAPLN
jgi:2-furoate---CoA ligase